jgi:hypothetical protein
MPTRESITGKLAKERDALIQAYRALTPDELTCECTKSEDPDGSPWAAKDHLAHLAMIERAFQGMIRRSMDGDANPVGLGSGSREDVIGRVHRNNEKSVDEHRGDSLDSLLADLDAARRETLDLLAGVPDDRLTEKVPGAPWADGTIGGVLITNAYHEMQHLAWVREGLEAAGE